MELGSNLDGAVLVGGWVGLEMRDTARLALGVKWQMVDFVSWPVWRDAQLGWRDAICTGTG